MATSILLKFQTLKCDISRTIWRIQVSDGSLFCIFHALSFERNLFFDRTCPLKGRHFSVIRLPLLTKEDCDLNQLEESTFVEQVDKTNSENNGHRKTNHKKFLYQMFCTREALV